MTPFVQCVLMAAVLALDGGAGSIAVQLGGLRSDQGKVGCQLFHSKEGFPGDPKRADASVWCDIRDKKSRCEFPGVAAGRYAVACIHDENGNGKLDTGLFGIPKEGVAASNDARGHMGPPAFDDAAFAFDGTAKTLQLAMQY
jgi:uncharacterized protein (DUF2141 family)